MGIIIVMKNILCTYPSGKTRHWEEGIPICPDVGGSTERVQLSTQTNDGSPAQHESMS